VAKAKAGKRATGDLAQIPAALLRDELRQREQRATALVRRYERLMERAAALRAEIQAAGGAIRGSSDTRARNETSLVEALARALSGKPLSVDEATNAVLAAGYRSASPEFRKIVNITLSRSDRFEQVERGRYTAKEDAWRRFAAAEVRIYRSGRLALRLRAGAHAAATVG